MKLLKAHPKCFQQLEFNKIKDFLTELLGELPALQDQQSRIAMSLTPQHSAQPAIEDLF